VEEDHDDGAQEDLMRSYLNYCNVILSSLNLYIIENDPPNQNDKENKRKEIPLLDVLDSCECISTSNRISLIGKGAKSSYPLSLVSRPSYVVGLLITSSFKFTYQVQIRTSAHIFSLKMPLTLSHIMAFLYHFGTGTRKAAQDLIAL